MEPSIPAHPLHSVVLQSLRSLKIPISQMNFTLCHLPLKFNQALEQNSMMQTCHSFLRHLSLFPRLAPHAAVPAPVYGTGTHELGAFLKPVVCHPPTREQASGEGTLIFVFQHRLVPEGTGAPCSCYLLSLRTSDTSVAHTF